MTFARALLALLTGISVLVVSSSQSHGPDRSRIDALASVEVVASLRQPMGVAVGPSGTVVVADRKAGVVYEIGAGGGRPLLTGLERPVGLAFDGAGRLLVVEERAGRLLALDGSIVTVLADGMRSPRWVAAGDDGTFYLSARGLRSEHRHRGHHDEDEEEEDDRGRPGDVILRLGAAGGPVVWADGFEGLEGLLVRGQTVLAAAEGRTRERRGHDAVFQVPIQADGSAGPVSRLTQISLEKPVGLALDVLGALYLSAERLGGRWTPEGVIGKLAETGDPTRFAARLDAPRGMALDGDGHLYVADGTGRHGRLLRFRAPAAPAVAAPPFATGTSVTLTGQAEPGARVDAVVADAIVASAVTADGSVVLAVPLAGNASSALTVYATAHEGRGLTGAPTALTIVRDGVAPLIGGLQPANGALLNTRQPRIAATFADALAGVDPGSAQIRLDGASVTALAQVTASGFDFLPAPLAEGGHTVFVQVADLTGNVASASAAFVVDVTGPSITGLTPADGATVTTPRPTIGAGFDDAVAGVDVASGRVLLDGVDRTDSATVTATGFSLDPGDLAAGSHAVSVSVADLAGNVTTAAATFTVALAPGDPLPPDPGTVAPPIDPTVATTVADATAFLYTGASPIQTGVAAGTIDPKRAVLLRGRVLGRDGTPLPGVTVQIANHPALGQTLSRADGAFDLVVNGGGLVTLTYRHAGFLPVQRQASVAWQDALVLPDVVMIPLDPIATTVDLAVPAVQVARGTPVADADGTRQATLLFLPGTQAELLRPDGSRQPITRLAVRATEYTVGNAGPRAMPAELPPASGYTYAVELSADEALAAGDAEVRFSQPVPLYVENFLAFGVGTPVPLGYYDRQRAQWIASPDGRVIRILAKSGGLAELDTTGDGLADNGVALGVTDAERARLADLYDAGQTLWRAPIPHFSPWDCNWPYGPPDDAVPPSPPPPDPGDGPDDSPDDPDCQDGSIIECQNQILRDSVRVAGTPYRLHYASDRVPGRKVAYSLRIPVSGSTVPASLRQIEVVILIAGHRFTQTFPPAPNQAHLFDWDGRDVYGRRLQGRQTAKIGIGYTYPAVYFPPSQVVASFAALTRGGITGSRARLEFTSWLWQTAPIGGLQPLDPRPGLGGWALDAHHAYDPVGRVLHLGAGSRRSIAARSADAIVTVAGNGAGNVGGIGDGGPATGAEIPNPGGMVLAADGSLYVSTGDHRVRRVGPDGIITTVAGTGLTVYNGDGIPATQANLASPKGIALGPDGSLYIAEPGRVRRVGPDGIITTVAGTGSVVFSGDGGPATLAGLGTAFAVDVAADGSLYIAEFSERVRRVGPDGIITTVAGTGRAGFSGDGGPAAAAELSKPSGVHAAADGSLYIADSFNHRIRRIGPDGIITTVAGSGVPGYSGDGGSARAARLRTPRSVVLGPDGRLYIADTCNHVVRRVDVDGRITTLAGVFVPSGCLLDFGGEAGPPLQARLDRPFGVAVGPDGDVHVADFGNHRIRRLVSILPRLSFGEMLVASEDGAQLFRFDATGRHLDTRHTLTGAVLARFDYDAATRLVAVTDGDGNVTTIERDPSGAPTVIVGPYGQRTTLALDADGYLATVTDPAGGRHGFTYHPDGLLASVTDPNGHVTRMSYDGVGRLTREEDPAGGSLDLVRQDDPLGFEVTTTTVLGRSTRYRMESLPTGGHRRVNTSPAGIASQVTARPDASKEATLADGSTIRSLLGPDARFGMQAPVLTSLTAQSGTRRLDVTASQSAVLQNPIDPLSVASLTDTATVNGRTATTVYTGATRTRVHTSPAGRTTTTVLDARGRPVRIELPGRHPVDVAYDARGRLVGLTMGARSIGFGYGAADGLLDRIGHPILGDWALARDAAGRPIGYTSPGGTAVALGWDPAGNLVSLAPPGRSAHTFGYTPLDRVAAYTPPAVAGVPDPATRYTYDFDRQLVRIDRPDSTAVALAYDPAGRLDTVTLGRGIVDRDYSPTTGKLTRITAPGGETVTYTHDRGLVTGIAVAGTVTGSIQVVHGNDFLVTRLSVNGADPINFAYDADLDLIQAGALALARDPGTGFVTGWTLGALATAITYNGFGEMETLTASHAGTALYRVAYEYDGAGRATRRTETVAGATDELEYAYDPDGGLAEVRRNGAVVATYAYDANGNRLSRSAGGAIESGVYDDQDRLLQYDAATFAHTAAGERLSRTEGGQVTRYDYDELGNLLGVTLAGGTRIDYTIDGRNRRIGKRVTGGAARRWLYQDALKPIAELNAANAVVSRFVYATRRNVPDYMIRGGVAYLLVTDALGSVRLVVDSQTGAVAQRLDYDEFGRVLMDTNPGFQPFGFAGGLHDPDTGLTRFGARDYDPETGRWTAKDPLGVFGGNNLYGYVRNDPMNLVDPIGRAPEKLPVGGRYILTPDGLEIVSGEQPELPAAGPTQTGQTTPSLGDVVPDPDGFAPDHPDNVSTELVPRPKNRQSLPDLCQLYGPCSDACELQQGALGPEGAMDLGLAPYPSPTQVPTRLPPVQLPTRLPVRIPFRLPVPIFGL